MAKKPNQTGQQHFLREWRKHRKLSQEELADRVGATHGLISQLERGITGLTHDRLERLAHALGCKAADILTGPPTTDAPPTGSSTFGGLEKLREALSLFSQLSEGRQRRIVESIEDAARAEGLQLPPPADGQ